MNPTVAASSCVLNDLSELARDALSRTVCASQVAAAAQEAWESSGATSAAVVPSHLPTTDVTKGPVSIYSYCINQA